MILAEITEYVFTWLWFSAVVNVFHDFGLLSGTNEVSYHHMLSLSLTVMSSARHIVAKTELSLSQKTFQYFIPLYEPRHIHLQILCTVWHYSQTGRLYLFSYKWNRVSRNLSHVCCRPRWVRKMRLDCSPCDADPGVLVNRVLCIDSQCSSYWTTMDIQTSVVLFLLLYHYSIY